MKSKDIAFWVMIIVVIILCIYLMYWVRTESNKCLANPIQYGVRTYSDGFSCSCSSLGSKQILTVTKDNMTIQNIDNNFNINLSNLKS
jgi:hypothetical protein